MIDLTRSKKTFSNYISDFDCQDPKIQLKIRHTYRVMDLSNYLCCALSLSKEQTELAVLIALLHDIGRFRQLQLTGSFDDSILSHAQCSLEVLFEQNKIREFLEFPGYDQIIYDAIKNHGVFRMNPSLSPQSELHTKLIRDADKLDNFYTKQIENMETMLTVSLSQLEQEQLSDYAYFTFLKNEPLVNHLRKTHLDMWVSYIAYIFDLNFTESFRYLSENQFITHLFDRVHCIDPKTVQQMHTLQLCAQNYIASKQ